MKTVLIFLLAFTCTKFSVSCIAAEPLSVSEKYTETLFDTTLVLDCFQTLDIKNHSGMYEQNGILGRHPSDLKVIGYFVGYGVGNYYIVKNISPEYRRYWQWGWIAAETATIIRNKRIGLNFNF